LKIIYNESGINEIKRELKDYTKQKAEEIIWETLQDIIYLRTGNYSLESQQSVVMKESDMVMNPTSIQIELEKGMNNSNSKYSVKMDSGLSSKRRNARNEFQQNQHRHLYISNHNQRNDEGSDDESDESKMFPDEYSSKSGQSSAEKRTTRKLGKATLRKSATVGSYFDMPGSNSFANFHDHQGQLIPKAMIESEIDLEADELRCLETFGNATFSSFSNDGTLVLPRYNDPILSLRILIEALARLKRLDDVERCLSENIDRELRKITELEQAKTLAKLEKRKQKNGGNVVQRPKTAAVGPDADDDKLRDFRMHLKSLLTSFGSVMLRLTHLAQILRHQIVSICGTIRRHSSNSYDTPE
jgi:hypothetical protein